MAETASDNRDVLVLHQFRTTLQAQVGLLAETPFRDTSVYAAVAAHLEKLDFTWEDAYFVEQSIVPYHSDDRILIEVERLLAQARQIMDRETSEFYAGLDPLPMSPVCRRELLGRLLVDIQLESQKRERRKWLLRRTCRRIVLLMVLALAVLVLHEQLAELGRVLWAWLWGVGDVVGLAPVPQPRLMYQQGSPGIGVVMLLALAGGCVGALVTVAMRMNRFFSLSRLREVESYSSRWYLGNRMLIGAVGALVGCYLVNQQIVTLFSITDLYHPLPKGAQECNGGVVYCINALKTAVVSIAFGCSEYFIPATFGKLPVPKPTAGSEAQGTERK